MGSRDNSEKQLFVLQPCPEQPGALQKGKLSEEAADCGGRVEEIPFKTLISETAL